ncbi:MAG: hypothetical protein GY856_45225, partial [bacterium]|nr:hypothetical protein [bacterium]
GILPFTWTRGEVDWDEERRLLFVGMTRARSRLFLSLARRRYGRGAARETVPSPFLRDIAATLLERRRGRGRRRSRDAAQGGRQLRLL